MGDKAWKKFERQVAHALGSQRSRQPGSSVPDAAPDCGFWLQARVRKGLNVWTWFREEERKATKAGDKRPVLVALRETGKQGTLAVVRLEVLVDLLEDRDALGGLVTEALSSHKEGEPHGKGG